MFSDMLFHVLLAASLVSVLASADQTPLVQSAGTEFSMTDFAQLSLDEFPSHKIRVKSTPKLCEDESIAASYSGYLDIGALSGVAPNRRTRQAPLLLVVRIEK
jgi:hypothetical protein